MKHAADSQVSDDPDHVRIVEEAAVWFATMHGGKASGREKNALKAWLAADPRHAEAYADINRLWTGAIGLPGMKDRHLAARKTLTRRRLGKAVIVGAVRRLPDCDRRTSHRDARRRINHRSRG